MKITKHLQLCLLCSCMLSTAFLFNSCQSDNRTEELPETIDRDIQEKVANPENSPSTFTEQDALRVEQDSLQIDANADQKQEEEG